MRAAAPSPIRLARYRRIDRRRGLPLPVGAALAVAVVVLGFGILWIGSGAVGPFVSGMVSGLGGIVNRVGEVVSSAPPTPAAGVADAPGIVAPDDAYTNDDEVDVTVTVPAEVVGSSEYTVRLWVTLKDEDRKVVAEAPVGPIAVQVIPNVGLSPGRNAFQASIAGPGGEASCRRSRPGCWTPRPS
jgi:hypothetical protein